jgi:superfamily II DNA helicase RecQ
MCALCSRPDYRSLGDLPKRFAGVPIMALTATATADVKADIQRCLFRMGQGPPAIFQTSFYRSNLFLRMCAKSKGDEEKLVEYLAALKRDASAIVYCISKRECDYIASVLCDNKLSAVAYHAGMGQKWRQQAQSSWQQGRSPFSPCLAVSQPLA